MKKPRGLSKSDTALVDLFADRAQTMFPPPLTLEASTVPDPEVGTVPDPDWWKPDVRAQRVARGVRQLFQDVTPLDEIARLRAVARALRHTPVIHEPEHLDLYLWLTSFLLYGRYIEMCETAGEQAGEETVLVNLPSVLQLNPAFFLGQWWIRGLLALWHETGERHKIEHVLLNSPGPGQASYQEQYRLRKENWVIFRAVGQLRQDGLGYTAALEQVEKQLAARTLGNVPVLSFSAIRTRYDALRRELFPPSQVGAEIPIFPPRH